MLALTMGATSVEAMQDRIIKPDEVTYRNRGGKLRRAVGVITEHSLAQVTIETGGKTQNIDTSAVELVAFGDVPPAYHDGKAYSDRNDFANAAAKFKLAAGDASARNVVKAAARLRAAQALMKLGAADPATFTEAKSELDRFLSDHASDRDVPTARMLSGRATLLTGDAAGAAGIYNALYKEAAGENPTAGYSIRRCYLAGLAAAEAFIASGDTLRAREIYSAMDTALPRLLAELAEDDPARAGLLAIQSEARLGEGFCLLATGNATQARTFFNGQASSAGTSGNAALLNGARLGLALVLQQEGKLSEAMLEFARVSALDHTSRDRVARALVGLAECTLQRGGSDANQEARRWLQIVRDQYGDTPSVLKAQELSKGL